jgi:uncharacterized protein involved in exopolysaccharide biosynthesis
MNTKQNTASLDELMPSEREGIDLIEAAIVVGQNKRLLFVWPLICGLVAFATTYMIDPTFVAKSIFMPPQQQQSAAASALQSLGGLAGLAGAAGMKSPGDQYVALMQSATVSNRVIDAFGLMKLYDVETKEEARQELAKNVRIEVGKKDGLVTVEVSDSQPERAAKIANRYIDELRRISSELAITEAQQRRVFFEKQLQHTKSKLAESQRQLQSTGVNEKTLRVEPKTAAEAYANLRAQVTAAEVRLQSMRGMLTNESPELKGALNNLAALRAQLAKAEMVDQSAGSDAYVNSYREYKYQETLFELFARQFELAKLDESREGSLIQTVDVAAPPEKKTKPRRTMLSLLVAMGAEVLMLIFIFARQSIQAAVKNESQMAKMERLKTVWRL